jgi:hypothetical protein
MAALATTLNFRPRPTTALRFDAKRTLNLAEHVGEQRPSLMVSPFAVYAEIAW